MKKIISANRKRVKYTPTDGYGFYLLEEAGAEIEKEDKAKTFRNQAIAFLKDKNFKEAIECQKKAVTILRELKTKDPARYSLSLANAHYGLAGFLFKKGDHEVAIPHLKEAIRIRELKEKDSLSLANLHNSLGN